MDWTLVLFELIDFRSFSNLWYWIVLAVTWSTASHWVLGVPYDMVLRAKRQGGAAEADLKDIVRVHVNRLLYIADEAGTMLAAFVSFALVSLAMMGFRYHVELCQAIFLIVFPLALVGLMSIRTARKIREEAETGEKLYRRLALHRVAVQMLGMFSILVTSLWGMLQNFNISVLPN